MRRVLLGLAGVLMTGVVTVIPSVAHAETTLCVGTDVKSTMKCDPGWAVNMMFMHWRMYRGHNCTNYVAWRLGRDGVTEPSYLLGNAVDWAKNAAKHGVPVDSKPEVGAVGAWSGRNHIVYVEQVGSDFLLLTEDSYSQKKYRRFISYKGESSYPTKFIHFQGKNAIRGGTPTISGKLEVGQALSATVGTWSPSGVKLSYQWLRDGVVISGATSKSYRLVKADAGRRISISVTGTYSGKLPRTTSSLQTDPVSAGTIKPGTASVTGTPMEGQTLTAATTGWTPSDIAVNYQWFADGDPIKNATSRTFALTSKQIGKTIVVRVTAYGPGYKAVPIKSAPTAKVVKKGQILGTITAGHATVSGLPIEGQTLTATSGGWAPAGLTVAYQWFAGDSAIKNATKKTFVVTGKEVGKTLVVRATASGPGRKSVAVRSTPTTKVVKKGQSVGAITAGKPTITGATVVGGTLTATAGTWGPAPVTTRVQWFRNGSAIKDATGWSHRLSTADVGKTLHVVVVGTKSHYTSVRASSAVTPKVAKQSLQQVTAPSISGSPQIGSVLTVNPGTWTPSGAKTFVVWTRDGKEFGKRGPTYTVVAGDARHVLGAEVTVQHDGLAAVKRTVALSKPIQVVPQFKTSWEKSSSKHAKVLKISATAAGKPVGGNVRVTEDGRTKGLVKLWYGGPASWEFKSSPGRHSLRLTYEGADWIARYERAIGVDLP